MKYLYYTLYLFYVKIIQLHKQYPPITNITAVISVLINFLVFSVVKIYYHGKDYDNYVYSILVQIILTFILWKFLYEYYKSRESKLIESIKIKPLWVRVIIVVFSALFIILVVKLWMFDGSIELYQYFKDAVSELVLFKN